MRWEPVKARRFSSLRLTPARVLVAVGAAIAMMAGLLPWAEGVAPALRGFEPVFFSGLGGAGDGVMLILVAFGAGALTLHRTPAMSRVRTVRLMPAILVVLAVTTWLNGHRGAARGDRRLGGPRRIRADRARAVAGRPGDPPMAAGTIWLLPEVVRWRRRSDDPAELVTVGPRLVAEVVAGIAGTFLGGVAGIAVALSLTGPTLVGTIALGAVFGGLAGAYAGSWLVRVAAERLAAARAGPARDADQRRAPARRLRARGTAAGRTAGTMARHVQGSRPAARHARRRRRGGPVRHARAALAVRRRGRRGRRRVHGLARRPGRDLPRGPGHARGAAGSSFAAVRASPGAGGRPSRPPRSWASPSTSRCSRPSASSRSPSP